MKTGIMAPDEYLRERDQIQQELDLLKPAAQQADPAEIAALLADLAALWRRADPAGRHELAERLFEAIDWDMDGQRLEGLHMRRALLPLRNALPEDVAWSGSDGILFSVWYIRSAPEGWRAA